LLICHSITSSATASSSGGLLAGFLFDWLTSLVDKDLSTPFSLVTIEANTSTRIVSNRQHGYGSFE
jgi:hypothetical protein